MPMTVAAPARWRLGVRGSVCQMAQWAGGPAARGAQEEIREEEEGGYCHFKV